MLEILNQQHIKNNFLAKRIGSSVFLSLLLVAFSFFSNKVTACTGLTVAKTVTRTNTCTPAALNIANTSSGTLASTSTYKLYVNNVLIDSSTGTSQTFSIYANKGNTQLKLVATTSTGCKDSVITTYTLANNAILFLDQAFNYKDTAYFKNCIPSASTPDSFLVSTRNQDSINNLVVYWGDGTNTSYSGWQVSTTAFSHNYKKNGYFNIKFTYTKTNGCADTSIGILENERIPSVGIIGPSSGGNLGCLPNNIVFVNNSSNISNSTKFLWDFGDGDLVEKANTTSKDTFIKTYNQVLCNGTVTLEANNSCGLSRTSWGPINISGKDKAVFSVSSICTTPGKYTFNNLSTDSFCLTPDVKSYKWNWGDGTDTGWITGKASITHTFASPGPKTICLYAKSSCGIDTFCQTVFIIFPPQANFLLDSSFACGNLTANVIDISSGDFITRKWTFSNGGTSTDSITSKFLSKAGKYSINLKVVNACGSSDTTKQITVYKMPQAKFQNLASGCIPHSVTFNNTSVTDFTSTASYTWSFGNGQSAAIKSPAKQTYTDSGFYTIKLRLEDNCGVDSVSQTIRVELIPTISIAHDSTGCTSDSLKFINNSSDATYVAYNFGDGTADTAFGNITIKHSYNLSGNYTVICKAVGPLNCSILDTLQVNIKQSSVAIFSTNKIAGCAGDSFTFSNSSVFAKDFSWFANGSLYSTNKTPASYHIATDSTVVTMKLVTTDSNNCRSDSLTHLFHTAKTPVASISKNGDSTCGPAFTTFLNTSQYAQSYDWKFGNGNTSTAKSPTQSFYASLYNDTAYSVRLIATNYAFCSDTTYFTQRVYPNPSISFSTDKNAGCGPLEVNVTNSSIPNDTGSIAIMNFTWDFGNGLTSTAQDSSSIFNASLTRDTFYTIKLIGLSEHGCTDSISTSVQVYPLPLASFITDTLASCGPKTIQFTNLSAPNDTGTIANMGFDWDFGNSIFSTTKDTSIQYIASSTKDSIYTVKLIAYSEHQCKDSAAKNITIYPKPLSYFEVVNNGSCSPLSVQFQNTSVPYDTGSIADMTFNWDFGQGSKSSSIDSSIVYNVITTFDTNYVVKLIAISEHNCKDTFVDSIFVSVSPKSSFTIDLTEGCGPLEVTVLNTDIQADSVYWNIGNAYFYGPADTAFTLQSVDLADTTYTLFSYSKTKYNCLTDTSSHSVNLLAQPIAAFTLSEDSLCFYEDFNFNNISQGATAYKWEFGDGNSSTDSAVTHVYSKNVSPFTFNKFVPKLTVTNTKGCSDTATVDAFVKSYTIAKINNSDSGFCSPATIIFSHNSINATNQWWTFDTSTINQPSFVDTYINKTNSIERRYISLRVQNTYGCEDSTTIIMQANPQPTAGFSFQRVDICDSGYHDLVNKSRFTDNVIWTIDGTVASTAYAPRVLLDRNKSGYKQHTIKLETANTFGCRDSITKTTTVSPYVVASFDTTQRPQACIFNPIQFTSTAKNAYYYAWYFGDKAISVDSTTTHAYREIGIFTVTHVAFDSIGCSDTITSPNSVTILQGPKADFSFTPFKPKIPYNTLVNFTDLSLSNLPLTYNWNFGDLGNPSNQQNPNHTYTDSGWYNVQLIVNTSVCSDTIIKPLYVQPRLPIIDFGASPTSGCSSLTVNFTNSTLHANQYIWSFGDGQTSTDENPTHTYMLPGYYRVSLLAQGVGGDTIAFKDSFIYVYENPIAYFTAAPAKLYIPRTFVYAKNESYNAVSYNWETYTYPLRSLLETSSDTSPTFDFKEVGKYSIQLVATDSKGCTDTLFKEGIIEVDNASFALLPNAFSPESSVGLNDTFKPFSYGLTDDEYEMKIYTRWGELLFVSNKVNLGWDGRYKGEYVQSGTYLFTVRGRFVNGVDLVENGSLTVVR